VEQQKSHKEDDSKHTRASDPDFRFALRSFGGSEDQLSSRSQILVTTIRLRRAGSISNCLTAASIACFSVVASTVPRGCVRLRMMSTDQRGIGAGQSLRNVVGRVGWSPRNGARPFLS
jgi:hypothetical protein